MTNTTADFVSYLKSLDVQVFVESARNAPLEEIRLRCSAPEGTLTPELRQELAARKAELISYLRSQSIEPTPGRVFPLSFAQQRLWFLYQLTPDNPFYNVPAAIRLTGTLDQRALERSFQEIVRRHAALRTTFTTRDGQPVQVVEPDVKVELSIVNLQAVGDRLSQQLATDEAQRPFNLTTDPLLRVTLLQFDATEAILLLTMHHIVADGWSLAVLIRELACFYTAFVEGQVPVLPPLPIQYTDFACWQRHWLEEVSESQLAYWRRQLQDLPVLHLPSDRPRPSVQTYRGATYPLQFSPLTQGLEALSQQSGVSLFMTLLAAFQTLLYRYTGQTDIAIGSPIANRHRSELEGLIGFFVNSLVMRTDLSGNPPFRELLERVRDVALEAYTHQDLPFEKLVEELDPDRDLSRNPLFQVAFALQNAPMELLTLPGLTLEPTRFESGSTRFDLEVHLWEPDHGLGSLWQSHSGLSGFISYSTDLFDRDRIERLVGHFQTLLEGIVANPDARLSELPLLTPLEHQQFSELQTDAQCSNDRCFHQIFEAQVQSAPEAIAVVSDRSLTYRELNAQADRLAQTLRQMGVKPDSLVGLCVERSADMVIGILGILKAGGAYVPLDPNYPSDRLQFILTDTQVSVLLTQSWLVESLPASPQIICLDQPLPPNLEPDKGVSLTPDQLAYVIYTSGSTGTPKGVLLTHRGLCNAVAAQHIFHPSRHSRVLQFSSLSFDASIFEIALALGSGGALYIPPKSAQLPGTALVQFLEDNAITHALLTPAVLAVLPSAVLPALQVLITGGEICSSQVVERWAANRRFFNAYGPTETTIWTTVAELEPGDNPLKIGRPIFNTQAYLLDAFLNPVPIGIPGELYIGGEGLARGYLNRRELTAERFIDWELKSEEPNPKSEGLSRNLRPAERSPKIQNLKSIRLYKTGDRAFYRPDGNLEFLGRVDHQIKIRGFRVELGEIEATLQRHPAIRDAVAIAGGDSANERLIAYFSLNRQLQQARSQSMQAQQLQHWQTLYNQTYQPPTANPQFNITGWKSSYTGAPIPPEQMQEWVSDRVAQILALKPKRVLEIGCGTGLLLFQIAPHVQKYVGTDFSLESIQNQLKSINLPHVELLHRLATDFEGIEAASFDVVILNSVVQYFPSVDYLREVLEKAIQSLATGGVLFVGDVRSLPLLTAFHAWMHFCQADAGMERTQLQQRVERSRFEEPELAIAPQFFYALREQFPQIRVQIRLSRGRTDNEMTQFRYNVLLHIEPQVGCEQTLPKFQGADSPTCQRHNWKLEPTTVAEIQKNLSETEPERLIITNVTNKRVNAAVKTANWLGNREAPKTVGRMREVLQDSAEAIAPQDWWDLETVLPYDVEITWSHDAGDYDVLLTRHGVEAMVNWSIPPKLDSGDRHTNDPLQSQFARQLVPELRQHLGKTLPDYMIPSVFVPLETLPLTASGKVDRRALPIGDLIHSSSTTSAPLTPTESTLIEIWKDLLRLQQVSPHDNFFELGGHSLLATQMTSRVRVALGLELPLKSVFEAPTIAQLAAILERDTTSTPIPPLVRLDRSAYRRQRSTANGTEIPPRHQDSQPSLQAVAPAHTATRSPLVLLTLGVSKQPFFCVHPMFGVVFPYLELANHLGSDRPFYGLQPLGLDGSPPLNRIEAIAAYYIQAIQSLQPQGPYFLGGWSFGGLVAFEMAQQLTKAGQQIGLLAILDTPAPFNKPSFGQSLKFLLGTAFWSVLPFLLDYGAMATHRLPLSRWQWSRTRCRNSACPSQHPEPLPMRPLFPGTSSGKVWRGERWVPAREMSVAIARLIPESRLQLLDESALSPMLQIFYANAQAAYRYVPQNYPNRITLFRAAEQSDATKQDLTLGWSALARDIQLHQVPGNHLSLLKQPHVQTLAQQLKQCLSTPGLDSL